MANQKKTNNAKHSKKLPGLVVFYDTRPLDWIE